MLEDRANYRAKHQIRRSQRPPLLLMRPAATSAARPCNIEVGPPVSLAETARGECDPPFKPHDRPDAPDEEESQTLPAELPCEDVPE